MFEEYGLRMKKVMRELISKEIVKSIFFRSRMCLTDYFVKVAAAADHVKPADRPRLMVNLIIESPFDSEARWCDVWHVLF